MSYQTPAPGACPPKAGASKKEIAKCATWKRESTAFGVVPGISSWMGTKTYYAFRIVDQKRRKLQPYYDQYVKWANSKSAPDAAEARSKLGIDLAHLSAPVQDASVPKGTTGTAAGTSSFTGMGLK